MRQERADIGWQRADMCQERAYIGWEWAYNMGQVRAAMGQERA